MRYRYVMRSFLAALLLAPASIAAPSLLAGGRPPAELAQALQKRYATIEDFSADFVHAYQGGVLRKRITERGHLLVKKPGKMRWEYTSPEHKLFVSDGVKMYSYIPQDKEVIVATVPQADEAATPALFLAGAGEAAAEADTTGLPALLVTDGGETILAGGLA